MSADTKAIIGTIIGTGAGVAVAIIAVMIAVWQDVRTDLRGMDARLRSVEQNMVRVEGRLDGIESALGRLNPPPHK